MNRNMIQTTDKQKEDWNWLKWYLHSLIYQKMQLAAYQETQEKLLYEYDAIDPNPKTIDKSYYDRRKKDNPKPPSLELSIEVIASAIFGGGGMITLLIWIFTKVATFINTKFLNGEVLLDILNFLNFTGMKKVMIIWLVSGILLALFLTVSSLIDYIKASNNYKKNYQKDLKEATEHNERLQKMYDKAVLEEKQEAAKRKASRRAIAVDISKLEESIKNCKAVISKLEQLGVVHKDYREFYTLYKLYEYISIGKCYELTGPYGAYNMYDYEQREEKKLEYLSYLPTIASQLDAIRSDNSILSKQLNKLDDTMNDIYQESVSTKRIMQENYENSKLAAMYAQQTADNTETIKKLSFYEKRLNGKLSENVLWDIEQGKI